MERFQTKPITDRRTILGVAVTAFGVLLPVAVSYAYITPGQFLGTESASSSSSSSSSAQSSGFPIPTLDQGGSNGGAGGLPIPTLDQGGTNGGGLPIPTLDQGGGNGGSGGLPIPNLHNMLSSSSSIGGGTSSSSRSAIIPCFEYDCLFPAAGSNSSSSWVYVNNGGGGGMDPNYVLYGRRSSAYAFPYPPYYQQPTYPPVAYPPIGSVTPPTGVPTLTVYDTNPGGPLSQTGPAEFLAVTLLMASAVCTYKRAARRQRVADISA